MSPERQLQRTLATRSIPAIHDGTPDEASYSSVLVSPNRQLTSTPAKKVYLTKQANPFSLRSSAAPKEGFLTSIQTKRSRLTKKISTPIHNNIFLITIPPSLAGKTLYPQEPSVIIRLLFCPNCFCACPEKMHTHPIHTNASCRNSDGIFPAKTASVPAWRQTLASFSALSAASACSCLEIISIADVLRS